MWRTIRKVLSKRAGAPNLRECVGQRQIGDKNDGAKSLNNEHQRHGNTHLLEKEVSSFVDGFNLANAILLHAKRTHGKQSMARLTSFVGEEKDERESNCSTTLFDELKLWCTGVLALSSVLNYKRLLYDKDHNMDIKRLPQVLYCLAIQNNPRFALAVLPVQSDTQHCAKSIATGDTLSHAASSFATASSECNAAYHNKLGVKYASKKQYKKAFDLFYQASEYGNSLALFNLGLCYENGKGVGQDLEKAVSCYKKACALNHKGALYNLALFYMEGVGGLPRDHSKALELLEKASEADVAKAQSYLGIYYANKSPHHYSRAISNLEKAAMKNDESAEYHLGVFYEHGLGVERNLVMAGKMYQAAASHGNVAAQYNVGVFYQYGLGDFPLDNQQALRYYRMAAEAGDQDARHNYNLLSKQLEKNDFKHGLLWTIFHKKTGKMPTDKGMARCSSSPNIVDSNKKTLLNNENTLFSF